MVGGNGRERDARHPVDRRAELVVGDPRELALDDDVADREEAAILFTLGALRKVQAGCLLTVSDIVVEGEFKRITDDELRAAVDRMTRVALATVTADH